MKNVLVILLIALLALPVAAQDLETSTISGGGGWMEGGGYKLFDIKCTPFSGMMTDGTYFLGVDGVYGYFVGVEEEPPDDLVWGYDSNVLSMTIRRDGSDIVVEWEPADPAFVGISYYVFRKTGDFVNEGTNWIVPGPSETVPAVADTPLYSYTDLDQVGGGEDQVYYRVLSVDNTAELVNRWAVGKFNVTLGANELRLIASPFDDGIVSDVFLEQMGEGKCTLYPFVGGGLTPVAVTYNYPTGAIDVRGADFNIGKTIGFWIREEKASPTTTITFCGKLDNPYTEDLGDEKSPHLDLTGNPLPFSLSSDGLGGVDGDTAYRFISGTLTPIGKKEGDWKVDFDLAVGEGMWYRFTDSRFWDVEIINQKAEIKLGD